MGQVSFFVPALCPWRSKTIVLIVANFESALVKQVAPD